MNILKIAQIIWKIINFINITKKPTPPVEIVLTDTQIDNVCFSYRHDFGLLNEEEKNALRFQAKEWLLAINKNL